jgi:biopolymer transport protein ExbD
VKLPDRQLETPTLNLSPLIDVIFILLIFVVMVARFIDDERLDVTPPSASAGRPAEVDALLIEVDAQGQVVVEGELIEEDDLHDVLTRARSRYQRAVLVADRDARLQIAVDVLSEAKLSGFEGVALATTPPEK